MANLLQLGQNLFNQGKQVVQKYNPILQAISNPVGAGASYFRGRISNTTSPINNRTFGQNWQAVKQDIRQNPINYSLPGQMARSSFAPFRFGGKAYEGLLEGLTANLIDIPAPISTNRFDRTAYVGGNLAGMFNPVSALGLGGKLVAKAPLLNTIQRPLLRVATTLSKGKIPLKIAGKAIKGMAEGLPYTTAYAGLKQAVSPITGKGYNKSDLGTDLGFDLALGAIGAAPLAMGLVSAGKKINGVPTVKFTKPQIRGDITKLEKALDAVLGTETFTTSNKWQAKLPARQTAKSQLEYYAENSPEAKQLLGYVNQLEDQIATLQVAGQKSRESKDQAEGVVARGKGFVTRRVNQPKPPTLGKNLSKSLKDMSQVDIDKLNEQYLGRSIRPDPWSSARQRGLLRDLKTPIVNRTQLSGEQLNTPNAKLKIYAQEVPQAQLNQKTPVSPELQDYEKGLTSFVQKQVEPQLRANQSTQSQPQSMVKQATKGLDNLEQKLEQARKVRAQSIGTTQNGLPSVESTIRSSSISVKDKVNALDYMRTPDRVLKKVGLANQAEVVKQSYNNYLDELPKEINKITAWYDLVGRSQESSKRIFQYLDGQPVKLEGNEVGVAKEIQKYLGQWADRLGLPIDKRIAHYITHIFEKDFIQKEFDPELARIITDKVPGSVYDPFLQERLGKSGYIEDAFRALDAYVKRATRKANMDPALEGLKASAEKLDIDSWNYVKTYADRINMRPTNIDNLFDNLVKTTPGIGYKLGQRPVANLSRRIRQTVFRGTLGLNIGSAIRNLTQGVNTYAQLGEKYTSLGYLKALKSIATRSDELDRVGVLRNSFIEDRTISATKQFWEKLDKGLFVFFDAAEKINRGAAYYGAKTKALAQGLSEEEAIKAGVEMARKTQFTFGSVDTPVALQSDIVKLLTQFQSFNVKQTEFLADMIKNKQFGGLIRWLGANTVILFTIGQAMGWDWKDMIPFGSVADGQSPLGGSPVFTLGKDVLKVSTGGKDQYGQPMDKSQILKDLIPLIPGGVQLNKTIRGIKDVSTGKVETKDQKLKYNIAQTPKNYLIAGTLGTSKLPEAQRYSIRQKLPKTDTDKKYIIDEESPIGAKRSLVNATSLVANPIETINLWMKGEPIKKVRFSGDNPLEKAKNIFKAITVSERAEISGLDKNKAIEVDHIKSKWMGGREEISNYQIITKEENDRKTQLDNELLKQFEAGDITKEQAWQQLQEFNKTLNGKPISQDQLTKVVKQATDKAKTESDGIEKYRSGGGATVEERANWVKTQLDAFNGTEAERQKLINDLWDEKVLTSSTRGTAAKLKEMGIDVSKYTGNILKAPKAKKIKIKKIKKAKKAKKGAKITVKTPKISKIKLKTFKPIKIKTAKRLKFKAYKPKKLTVKFAKPKTQKIVIKKA